MNVIVPFDRHEVARQAEGEVCVADGLHLGEQFVHHGVRGFVIEQAVGDGDALYKSEPIIVKLSVLTLPAGKHAGRGVEEGRRVGGAQLRGFVGEELRVGGVIQFAAPGR